MEGIGAIDDIVPRGEPASDKFFRILRFFAPTVYAIRRERERVIRSFTRSFVHSFVRSLSVKRTSDLPTDRCGTLASANRYALSSSLRFVFFVFLQPSVSALSDTVRLCRGAIFRSSVLHRSRSPMRRWFYLIALLCFIEQLFARAQFVFLRSLPETAVSVISRFNIVALLEFECAASAPGYRMDFYTATGEDLSWRK